MSVSSIFTIKNQFRVRLVFLATVLLACSFYSILDFSINIKQNSLTYAYIWAIMAVLTLITVNFANIRNFLFSCAFWVVTTFILYIVLKSIHIIDQLDPRLLQKSLTLSLLFLIGYLVGQFFWPSYSINHPSAIKLNKFPRPSLKIYWLLIFSFIGFKLLNYALMLFWGGGDTALDISAATQNQGASYIFKIPALANASYFLILLFAYKYGYFKYTALLMTAWMIIEAILGAGRYVLVTSILINLLLYHLYIRSIRSLYLVLLVPPLVFFISLLGYVRNIEIGTMSVYVDTIIIFIDDFDLIFELFLARLDMLPQITEALRLDELNQLKFESGMSYIYSFLHAIPRNLWENKPLLTAAYVTELVNPGVYADGVNVYPSIMLEAYMNFLWPGVIIIGVLIARMSSFYDNLLRHGSLIGQTFALMAFTFPMSIINEGLHSNILATLIYLFVLYMFWLATIRFFVGYYNFFYLVKN